MAHSTSCNRNSSPRCSLFLGGIYTLLIFVLVGSTIASHSQEETIFGYKNTRRKVEESDDDGTDRHDKDPEDKDVNNPNIFEPPISPPTPTPTPFVTLEPTTSIPTPELPTAGPTSMPTSSPVNQPTTSIPTPELPTAGPTSMPPPSCFDETGVFGDTSSEDKRTLVNYFYEVETDPSVSASVSDDILPQLEVMFVNALLPSLFSDCRPNVRSIGDTSIQNLEPMLGISSFPSDLVMSGTFELEEYSPKLLLLRLLIISTVYTLLQR